MRIRVALCLVLFCYVSHAQNIRLVDSLRRQLPKASPTKQVELMNAIGFEFRYSFPDSTIYYCQRAYDLGKQLQLKKELSKPLSFIGLAYANKGDYKNSFTYHHESIDVAISQNDSVQLAFGYNNLGRMFFDQGDLVRAYDNFIRAKDIFEALDEKPGLAYVYRSLANIHASQKDFANALAMSRTAYDLRRTMGDPRMIISSLMELGLIQEASGDSAGALSSFLKADSLSDKAHDPVTEAELNVGLAEILLAEGKLEEAYERANEVQKIVSASTNQKLFLRARQVQADYYYKKRNFDKAIPLLENILQSAEGSGNVTFQRDATFLLSEIYKRKNDTTLANEYKNKHRIFSEMLQNSDLSRQIDRLQFQLEIEKKEKENELLKANEARNKVLLSEQRFQNILLIIVVASIALIALIAWSNSRRRRLINHKLALQNSHILSQREEIAKQNETLSSSNQILSDLNQEKNTLMNIVAHDLKSPLNRIHGLTNLMEMEGGLSASQQEYVRLIKSSTRSGLDLIIDLLDVNAFEEVKVSAKLTELSLKDLLEERVQLLRMAASEKAISLTLETDLPPKIVSDGNYLGRIVDNLLSNAIKFSNRGGLVQVRAYQSNGSIAMAIRDHGPGFSESDKVFLFQKFKKLSARPTGGESSNGLGLAIVKTLVERLNGTIELKSEQGKGSEFIIVLPLKYPV